MAEKIADISLNTISRIKLNDKDERIIESILDRYIMPLTIMGGLAIGLLAALTDLLGALVSGTAILLVIMIMFQFYQNIAQQQQMDMSPMMRKFIK